MVMCKLLENEKNIIDEDEFKIRWHFKYSSEENKQLIISTKFERIITKK